VTIFPQGIPVTSATSVSATDIINIVIGYTLLAINWYTTPVVLKVCVTADHLPRFETPADHPQIFLVAANKTKQTC